MISMRMPDIGEVFVGLQFVSPPIVSSVSCDAFPLHSAFAVMFHWKVRQHFHCDRALSL